MKTRRLRKGPFVVLAIILIAIIAICYPQMKKELTGENPKAVVTPSLAENNEASKNGDLTNQKEPNVDKVTSSKEALSTPVSCKGQLDNWSGWFSLIAANGGNTTSANSYYGQQGLDVSIEIIDSDDEKLQNLINGNIDFTACTINRLSLISGDLAASDTLVVVPYLTDASNGGDGIVAKKQFTSIESLKDATIGVGKDSVSHALIVWAIQNGNNSDEQKASTIHNIRTYPSATEATQAYLNGDINALATWQPYVDEAANFDDSHILLSTKSSSSLIMDALIFRKDFVDAHPDVVKAMIDGALSVVEDMKNKQNVSDYCSIFRNSLPDFAESSDEEILQMLDESTLMDWHDNINAFSNTASPMFFDMCTVWESIGKETVPEYGDSLFDNSYLMALSSKFESTTKKDSSYIAVTAENKQQVIDTDALLTKTTTVNFKPQTSLFMDDTEAANALDEFVKIAKILDGSIIQIEGNVSSRNTTEAEEMLSLQRAESVKKYLVEKGIQEGRIITIGNGGHKPVYSDPQTSDEYKQNRRVDLLFKIIEE